MKVVRTIAELRTLLSGAVGFVPTMGYLHKGHLALIESAARSNDSTVMSLFVNPTQFNDPKDLEAYPRDEARDVEMAASAGCDIVFAPDVGEMYPEGMATTVHVAGVSDRWEGAHRPGHFDGVETVVAKLFGIVGSCTAYFGEKDWQQCCVVSQMVSDLNMPISLQFVPTVREPDGLAMSSRNERLSPEAREKAPALFRNITEAATAVREGMPATVAEKRANHGLLADGFDRVDYVAVVNTKTLEPIAVEDTDARVIAAATIGGIRLIDNVPL